jgi:hypothetical protein
MSITQKETSTQNVLEFSENVVQLFIADFGGQNEEEARSIFESWGFRVGNINCFKQNNQYKNTVAIVNITHHNEEMFHELNKLLNKDRFIMINDYGDIDEYGYWLDYCKCRRLKVSLYKRRD